MLEKVRVFRWLQAPMLGGAMLLTAAASSTVAADDSGEFEDWPQAGGLNGDYVVSTPPLRSEWPDGGPPVNWRRPLGFGYSGIAVVGDRLFTAYRTSDQSDGEEVLIALELETGDPLWERRAAAPFAEYHKLEHGVGPHVTPTVVDGRVFFAGIYGDLVAVDAESGELRWSKELIREHGGTEGSRGYSNSPLALDGRLIVPVGGEAQGVMALEQSTGEVVWSRGDFDRGYSSPTLIEVDGQKQLVLFNREEVMGLDPSTGERLWSHDHTVSFGLSISVPTYYPDDHLLFLSTAYNGGSRVLRLTQQDGATSVEEVWAHKQMRIHIGERNSRRRCRLGSQR